MAKQYQQPTESASSYVWAAHALLADGWASDVRIGLHEGRIVSLQTGVAAEDDEEWLRVVVPGLGNLHSHAFQRGMAGLTEIGGEGDSFWTWRELMYRFLHRLDPDSFRAIAAMAYVEMLEAGFTRVGEFHYLHHAVDGKAYADPAEMAVQLAAAATQSGIGMTLLPVFYAHANFGGVAPDPAQRRLITDIEGFDALLHGCRYALGAMPDAVLGLAPHSLRAVTPEELVSLPALCDGPLHIHIAEQLREVEACVAWSGQRPVRWLLDHAAVDSRWCLVHATHVDDDELEGIAGCRAVVGLCPITEANLGDGLFPMRAFARRSGRFGVGSDSNVLIDAAEELRLLEYGQRLLAKGRNVLAGGGGMSSGRWLFQQASDGAAQALGGGGSLQLGAVADMVELDFTHPALVARGGDAWLDGWLFAARHGAVRSVWRRGTPWVREGRHLRRDEVASAFARAMKRVLDA